MAVYRETPSLSPNVMQCPVVFHLCPQSPHNALDSPFRPWFSLAIRKEHFRGRHRRRQSEILSKETEVWSVAPETKVFDVLGLMAEKRVGAVLVLEKDKLVGLFSE
jgi:CBS domain-containing protein